MTCTLIYFGLNYNLLVGYPLCSFIRVMKKGFMKMTEKQDKKTKLCKDLVLVETTLTLFYKDWELKLSYSRVNPTLSQSLTKRTY